MDLEMMAKHENILIVHEQSDECRRYKAILEENGYSVFTAETVSEGMSIAADVKFAMVFHDMVIEEESAMSFMRQVKEDAVINNLPVVVLIDKDMGLDGIEKISKDLREQMIASPPRSSMLASGHLLKKDSFQIIHNTAQ